MSCKITRKVASRRLKRRCEYCNTRFLKGDVYYLNRYFSKYDGEIITYEYLECAKCKYKRNDWEERYERFKSKCSHPKEFTETFYDYILGEAVMEPKYDVCTLCGTNVTVHAWSVMEND